MYCYQTSALQFVCDTSIARVTGCCVCPREGYRSVTPLLMPGPTGLRRQPCFEHENCTTPIKGDRTRRLWNSLCIKHLVLKWFELTIGMGYLGLPGLHASSCVFPVNMAGQRRSSPGLTLGMLLSSHERIRGGCRSLLFGSDLSYSPDDVMQFHTHTPVMAESRPTSEIWRSSSGVGRCTLDPIAFRTHTSHTTGKYTN